MAMAAGGRFLLRIEDIDQTRCHPKWEIQLLDDLNWLGVHWEGAPMRQSDRLGAYRSALDSLWQRELIYPCHCTRRDIAAAAAAPQEGAALLGPDGLIYPGTCWNRVIKPYGDDPRPEGVALRLNMSLAAAISCDHHVTGPGATDWHIGFDETGAGTDGETGDITMSRDGLEKEIGDVVLSRRDFPGSYHLSVVLDDAAQGITHVVRGQDLFEATKIHVVLQRLLGLPTPTYHHHRLIRDDQGKRLAKRDDARAISKYRAEGASPQDIRKMVGLV